MRFIRFYYTWCSRLWKPPLYWSLLLALICQLIAVFLGVVTVASNDSRGVLLGSLIFTGVAFLLVVGWMQDSRSWVRGMCFLLVMPSNLLIFNFLIRASVFF